MPEPDDHQLLAQFTLEKSESAFAALVTRHVGLVHSVALRSVGSPHAAEEITQAVFIILARKAAGLSAKIILSGWLYQTTRLTAANHLRTEIRRQNREQEAFMQSLLNEPDADTADTWRQIAPLLDAALDQLGPRDRDAIALRFFEHKSLAEVGAALGTGEGAAKMRVNRALEKLRKIFSRRGVALSTALIAVAVAANSVQAAPAGLAISTVAAVKGSAATVSTLTLVKGTLKVMTYAKLKLALGIAVVTLLTAGTMTVALSAGTTGPAGDASAQEKAFSAEIMLATKDQDYQAFIADGDQAFSQITELQFKAVCVQLTPRLQTGYNLVFLGALKQNGYHVTLWKVAHADGGDDELLTLSVKDGKIGGAYIR